MDTNQTVQIHRTQVKKFKSGNKFTQKEVDLAETPLFFPEGFEKIFLAIYFVTLPYIAGLLFLFFYVAEGDIDLFLSLNEELFIICSYCDSKKNEKLYNILE